jgi:transposase InsO family protein
LAALIAALFARHRGSYGAPRITADLQEMGWRVSQNTVAALLAEQGLRARAHRRRRGTTRPGKGRWSAPDLVGREFTAARVNQRWFGDGTEIDTAEGKLQLASVLDVCSRRIVGFALSERHDAELAYGSLAMAVAVRGGQVAGVVLHTDRGSEGVFNRSLQHLDNGGVDGQASWVDEGIDGQVGDEVAGGSVASAGRGAIVLV